MASANDGDPDGRDAPGGETIEVEARFLVADPVRIESVLGRLVGGPRLTMEIEDRWYAPVTVVDNDTHEQWLRHGLTGPLRIRSTTLAGRTATVVEAKRPATVGDYGVSHEARLSVRDVTEGSRFVTVLGYHQIALLNKVRTEWRLDDCVAHLDAYRDGPTILELEALSTGSTVSDRDALVRAGERTFGLGHALLDASSALHIVRQRLAARPLA